MPTTSIWQRLPVLEVDVAIVGGGVVGTATAWSLHGRGLRVAVLEAERLAHGASGRNAGFLLLGTSSDYASAVETYGRETAQRVWAFTERAYRLAAEVGQRHDVGFRATGSVLAAGSDLEAERLSRSRDLLLEDGVESAFLEDAAANARIGSVGFPAALVVSTGGAIDPVRLVRALATESGAAVLEGARVTNLEAGSGRTRIVLEGGGEVRAARVLIAANAYLPQLRPELSHVVRPVRAQMLATAPAPPTLAAPVYSHHGYVYLRQRCDGRVLVGGARHLHRDLEVGYDDETTPALQADLEA